MASAIRKIADEEETSEAGTGIRLLLRRNSSSMTMETVVGLTSSSGT